MRYNLLLALPLALVALAPVRGDDRGSASAAVRACMQPFVDQGEISGAVTVVGRKDAILSYEAIGLQNLETRTPMAKDTLFRIASMTKPITAIGIMILVDEGKLKAEDPVEKYLPEFHGQMLAAQRSPDAITLKKPARPITLRDLLTHTSGLQSDFRPGLTDLYIKRNHTLAEGVMAFSQRPLDFEPGSKWAYCNAGIDTLGRIIEVVSHQFYEDFLRTRIFQPLGMSATTFYPNNPQLEHAAVTYGKQNGKLVPTPNTIIASPVGARYPVPAGGLYSTGADLAKLYQMMLNRGTLGSARILRPEAVATMTKVQTGTLECGFVPGMSFGYGWAVVREPKGVTDMLSPGSYGHGGAFGTQGWLDPTRDLFVVLLIQRTGLPNSDASPMRKALQEAAVSMLKK
jgi:CubicO group peptidase (beta-lactamase class C family)